MPLAYSRYYEACVPYLIISPSDIHNIVNAMKFNFVEYSPKLSVEISSYTLNTINRYNLFDLSPTTFDIP